MIDVLCVICGALPGEHCTTRTRADVALTGRPRGDFARISHPERGREAPGVELDRLRRALALEVMRSRRLQIERDEARYNARILAHSYESDSRSPERVVRQSLEYPTKPNPG